MFNRARGELANQLGLFREMDMGVGLPLRCNAVQLSIYDICLRNLTFRDPGSALRKKDARPKAEIAARSTLAKTVHGDDIAPRKAGGRVSRQPGQIRKEAAVTSFYRGSFQSSTFSALSICWAFLAPNSSTQMIFHRPLSSPLQSAHNNPHE